MSRLGGETCAGYTEKTSGRTLEPSENSQGETTTWQKKRIKDKGQQVNAKTMH